VILFVGRMDPAKGVDLLLESVSVLLGRGVPRPTVLIVGGDNGNRDAVAHREIVRLKAVADGLGLADVVRFDGVVPQDQLPTYYAASEVCSVPSRYESFGMVALEALASGRPVVGFLSPGLMQTVKDGITGYLVPSGDVQAQASALEAIIRDPGLAQRMGSAARESACRYSWDRVADQTTALYSDLLRSENAVLQRLSS